MPAIETDVGTYIYRTPGVTVSAAPSLLSEFQEVPYLRLESLRDVAAPDVGEAVFRYVYGPQFREDSAELAQYPPLDLVNKFVRVEIAATVEGDLPIVWHGIVEGDVRDVHGSDSRLGTGEPAGVQTITAYGLLRLLERQRVEYSHVAHATEDVLVIRRALPFNLDVDLGWTDRGNRHPTAFQLVNGTDDAFPFARYPRTGSEWDARQAVDYTLATDAPRIGRPDHGNLVPWVLVAPTDTLDWVNFSVRREGRSVKQVLDELIDRRRGVGYTVYYDEDALQLVVWVFTFAKEALELPSGATIAANAEQVSLDFEQAFDIESAVVRRLGTQQYDRIVVLGAWRTSTATFSFKAAGADPKQFEPEWTSTDQTAYLAGFSGDASYAGLDESDKQRKNEIVRSGDEYGHVFARWRIAAAWNGRIAANFHGGPLEEYFLVPPFDDAGDPVQPWDAATNPNPQMMLWTEGLQFEPRLTLRERLDYSGTRIETESFPDTSLNGQEDLLPPLVWIKTDTVNAVDQYEQVEKLALDSEKTGRKFQCSVRVLRHGPLIEVKAHPANQFLAKDEWTAGSPATTVPEKDPDKENSLDWKNLGATLTVRLDARAQAVRRRPVPADPDPEAFAALGANNLADFIVNDPLWVEQPADRENAPGFVVGNPYVNDVERVLWIDTGPEKYRLDYVVPETVVEIKNGLRVASTSGGFVRDDRDILEDIARAAQEWYASPRNAFTITYRQVRGLFEIGQLITDVGNNYTLENVNSVITAIEYRFPESGGGGGDPSPPTTTIETSYTDLDLA